MFYEENDSVLSLSVSFSIYTFFARTIRNFTSEESYLSVHVLSRELYFIHIHTYIHNANIAAEPEAFYVPDHKFNSVVFKNRRKVYFMYVL